MKRILAYFLSLLTVFVMLSTSVYCITPIDPTRSSSLTLQYAHGGKYYGGLEIKTFRIAEVFPDGTYALTGEFAKYPVKIYEVTSQSEWRAIASTLAAYIHADGIEPTCTNVTDILGTVSFTDILPGMYLTLGVSETEDNVITVFETFLTVVPYPSDDGNHNYDVTAYPKCEEHEFGGDIEYKVVKLWKDKGYTENRPESVTVDILKDGVLWTSVQLSSENNFSYTWTTADDGSVWHAVERNVSEGYTVSVVRSGDTFLVTNKYIIDIPGAPQTGEPPTLWIYVMTMSLSGMVLILISTWRKRREE